MRDGIICVNKPEGFTSFDVIAKLRGMLKLRRIGHAGTLDPMATGVLPVFLGRATLACDLLPDADKRYVAGFSLGMTTDTQDITGTTLSTTPSNVTADKVKAALLKFTGEIDQIPPMYSAIKVGGKKLYDLAREGVSVERKARCITVYEIKLLDFDEVTQTGHIEVFCSKGTYIRTICHDLGESLEVGGVMTSLTRSVAAGFTLDDCLTLDEIQSLSDNGEIEEKILPIDRVFSSYRKITLSEKNTKLFLNGVKITLPDPSAEDCTVYSFDNRFLGLGCFEGERLRIKKLFLTREQYEEVNA